MIPDSRRLLLVLAAFAVAGGVLAGCPIPQPLPGVGNTDGGVTPPRILADGVQPNATFIPYDDAPGACDGGARFVLRVTVVDQTPDDQVEGRWFIDYSISGAPRYAYYAPFNFTVQLPDVTSISASFPFAPVAEGWPGLPVHVVELVVSNGYDNTNPDGGLPNRAPRPGYETTLYRWVFEPVPGSAADGGCGP